MLLKVILLGDDCHWMEPVLPESVKVVLLVPEHTVDEPLMLPATLNGLMVKAPEILVTTAQVLPETSQ